MVGYFSMMFRGEMESCCSYGIQYGIYDGRFLKCIPVGQIYITCVYICIYVAFVYVCLKLYLNWQYTIAPSRVFSCVVFRFRFIYCVFVLYLKCALYTFSIFFWYFQFHEIVIFNLRFFHSFLASSFACKVQHFSLRHFDLLIFTLHEGTPKFKA